MQLGTQEIVLRLLIATISGGIIGYERSLKGIDAGFRTHILVCMSSCAIMLTNLHAYIIYGVGDPMRMPAQVISGVGFLGAGCILVVRKQRIKGVTTAAGIWSAACLGLCIGAGDYPIAAFMLIAALLSLTVFRIVDKILVRKTRYLQFYAELESVPAMTGFMKYLQSQGMKVTDIEFLENKISSSIAVVISIRLKKPEVSADLIALLGETEGVVYAAEL